MTTRRNYEARRTSARSSTGGGSDAARGHLAWLPAAGGVVRSDQLDTEAFANLHIQRIAVVGTVADQPLGSFGEEASFDGGSNELCFMRRSAGHVHGERKTMGRR